MNGAEDKQIVRVGEGIAAVWNAAPSSICTSGEKADEWWNFFTQAASEAGFAVNRSNHITEKRGPYFAAAVFGETDDDAPFIREGLFSDMYSPCFDVTERICIAPDDSGLWFDYSEIEDETLRVIGTGARVFSLEDCGDRIETVFRGASSVRISLRVRVPYPVECEREGFTCECDRRTRTVLLSYNSIGGKFPSA